MTEHVSSEDQGGGGGGELRMLAGTLDPDVWVAEDWAQDTVGARSVFLERRRISELHAQRALAAGWRPPLPDWEKELLDDTRREYTENDLAEAFICGKRSWDLHVEWGCRSWDGTTQRLSATSREDAVAARLTGTKLGYQMVGPWTEDED